MHACTLASRQEDLDRVARRGMGSRVDGCSCLLVRQGLGEHDERR
jgi:hypothetical protein